MIIIGGKPYRTLADPIYTNGKRVQKVFVNGKQAYPEIYKKPAIGSSGNVLKIRGKHTTTLNLYSDGTWYDSWIDPEYSPVYNETIKGTISYAAYIRQVPAAFKKKEAGIILKNDRTIAPYKRAKDIRDVNPKIDGTWSLSHRNFGLTIPGYDETGYCMFRPYDALIKDCYAYELDSYGLANPDSTFIKFIFKIEIDPFHIPSEHGEIWNSVGFSPYHRLGVSINNNYVDRHCLFNNKIFTVYTNFINPDGNPGKLDEYTHFYMDFFNSEWAIEDGHVNYKISSPETYGCWLMCQFNNYGFYDYKDVRACSFSIQINILERIKNAALFDAWNSKGELVIGASPMDLYLLTMDSFRCSPEEILYIGDEIDPETGKEVPLITKEDLIDFNGSEEVLDPIIDGIGPIKTDVYEYPIEVKLNDTIIKQNVYGGLTTNYKHNYIATIDAPNATEIETSAFYNCRRLIYAIFPNVTAMGSDAFFKCTGLAVASFPLLLSIPTGCFNTNITLETVNFPICTNIGAGAFGSCYSLESVNFPACLTIEAGAFYSCYLLESVNFPACNNIGANAFRSCSSLSSLSFPACTNIGSYAFSGCSSLSSLNFPACLTIESDAFYGCNITEIDFPACTSISIGGFRRCGSLVSVNFPACTNIGNSGFAWCSSLTEANFPACTNIGSYAFQSCSSLASLNFPACTVMSQGAFASCFSLVSVSFPVCSYIGYLAFRGCSSLTVANFPACKSTQNSAFYSCDSLVSISLPVCTSIGSYAFKGCTTLPSVTLPSVTYIGSQAFAGCTSLSVVVLGKTYTMASGTYRDSVFANSPNLKSLYLLYNSGGRGCPLSLNMLSDSTILDGTCKIYVPSETYSYYMQYWSQFASQIVSIAS